MKPTHPMQPVVLDSDGRTRFKQNTIVRFLLDQGPIDMNTLAKLPFPAEDRSQFAQLIGYSTCGFGELQYANPEHVAVADGLALKLQGKKK